MKTKRKNYVAPICRTIFIDTYNLMCTSAVNEKVESTHESFMEENYIW